MNKTLLLAAAAMLFAAPAFAQSNSMSGSSSKDAAANAPTADASAMPKKHMARHRVSKTEAQKNAEEAETTRQLNQDESQYASNTGTGVPGSMDVRTAGGNSPSGNKMSNDPNRPRNGMGRVTGANSGVEGRVGGSNSNGPAPQ
jgi:hypothetical protein